MLSIYTDGGCYPNPGFGAWAMVAVEGDEIVWEMADFYFCRTTNNRMEMIAVLCSLEYLIKNRLYGPITLFSDSQWVVNTYNHWGELWASQGWRNLKRERVKNIDLIKQMLALKRSLPLVKVEWVKGHSGNKWNNHADKIVRNMLKSFIDPENIKTPLKSN